MSDYKIAIGIPNMGTIKTKTFYSIMRMLKDFPYEYDVILQEGCAIHHNRTKIVEKAIEFNCTHLLFVDTDMYFEKEAVFQLLNRDKDIVGVHVNQRKDPPTTTVLLSDEKKLQLKEHPTDFLTCDGLGTGFLLIKLDIFEKIEKPWFFWGENEGEDFWFCSRAKKAGFEVWVDLAVKVGHIGEKIY